MQILDPRILNPEQILDPRILNPEQILDPRILNPESQNPKPKLQCSETWAGLGIRGATSQALTRTSCFSLT